MDQAIISLKPRYVELILSGKKTVELRNRVVRMDPGTVIWIYATRPVGGIVALAELSRSFMTLRRKSGSGMEERFVLIELTSTRTSTTGSPCRR